MSDMLEDTCVWYGNSKMSIVSSLPEAMAYGASMTTASWATSSEADSSAVCRYPPHPYSIHICFADREDVSPAMILNSSLPVTDLYSLSITRIHQLKYGPFHEHSPQLHSIAQGVARWSKVNSGMFKMYEVRLPSVLHDVWNNISRTGGGIGKAGRGTTYPFGRSASMGKFFCTGRSHCVWVWGNDRNYCALGILSSSHEQFRCDSHSGR